MGRGPASGNADRWRALWRHRSARDAGFVAQVSLAVLAAAGLVATIRLFDWWFRRAHIANLALFIVLSIAFWYSVSRLLLGWINYVAITKPPHRSATPELTVAVFVTSAPGEPLSMFERTLAACARLRHPHTTYLLDDTRDPRFGELAAQHGAVWLELLDIPGAKAGKINRALAMTDEAFVLVLDPDHIPFPEFLDRVLGHFADERVGFVQVAQAYYNQHRSFTAVGAAQQTYAFYGPGQMGLYGHGASVAIGANCTFRRTALDSIGGHGIGLAEDLVTSIRLHAGGWRSVYVPEIVSRGLVPEDLGSFQRQQRKWARGVFEVAFAELPRLFGRLTWRQRLSYLTIATYYLNGLTTMFFLALPYVYLWTGAQPAAMAFDAFLAYVLPVGVAALTMYLLVQRWFCDPSSERGLHFAGLILKASCWHVFLTGTMLAILRADLPYVPTAKEAVQGRFLRLAWPALMLITAYAVTLGRVIADRMVTTPEAVLELSAQATWGMMAFATVPVVASCGTLYAAWQSRHAPPNSPWDAVDVQSVGGPA
jgi:cellulose synthase (UDP-forming)